MDQLFTELTQYGMNGLFIGYLIYDSQRREKRANDRMDIESKRSNEYLETLSKITGQLESLSRSSQRQEVKNDRVLENVRDFIKTIK